MVLCAICNDRSLSVQGGVARLSCFSFSKGHYKAATGFSEVQRYIELIYMMQIRSLICNQ